MAEGINRIVSYSSEMTRKRIMECAQQEFMEHGYQGASMRRIAAEAKVTTGAMYNHFSNKAVLFDELVQEPAKEMLATFQAIHDQAIEGLHGDSIDGLGDKASDGSDWMLDYIYSHVDAFRLIFCRSEGTQWAEYIDRLAEIEEKAHRVYYDAIGVDSKSIDSFFVHVSSSLVFQYFSEMLAHDLPYERAVAVMDNVKRHNMAGWSELLGREI